MKTSKDNRMVKWALRLSALGALAVILPACGGSDGAQGPPGSADAWSRLGNAGTVDGLNFLGTTDNVALDVQVNGFRVMRFEPAGGTPNVIGGWFENTVTPGASAATIFGGAGLGGANRVTDTYGTVGGGVNNQAGDNAGTTLDALFATVAGGSSNTASGNGSSVPGGLANIAAGSTSFAGGFRAQALHSGAFVWGDSTSADVTSTGVDQFIARAAGGTTFWSNGAATLGATLAPNATAWAIASDRNMKANVVEVDGRETLEKLAAMPISTWTYKDGDPSMRHMGPMAQDFRSAFRLGWDEKHITTVDADGVALSAIQGLYAIVKDKEKENGDLKAKVASLEERLAAIEKSLGK